MNVIDLRSTHRSSCTSIKFFKGVEVLVPDENCMYEATEEVHYERTSFLFKSEGSRLNRKSSKY